ncbi:type VI secretion system baseplate subunit TssK [Caulobacter segnis]
MQSDSRVAWREGLFLRQQHFQQQDRYLEALITARANGLRPYPWGVSQLKINADLAALGKFAIESMTGVAARRPPFRDPRRSAAAAAAGHPRRRPRRWSSI